MLKTVILFNKNMFKQLLFINFTGFMTKTHKKLSVSLFLFTLNKMFMFVWYQLAMKCKIYVSNANRINKQIVGSNNSFLTKCHFIRVRYSILLAKSLCSSYFFGV